MPSQSETLGWIKTPRIITNFDWYYDPIVLYVFIHCNMRANYVEKTFQGINIPKGAFLTSLARFSYQIGVTLQQLRTALEKLEQSGVIFKETKNRQYTIVQMNYFENDKNPIITNENDYQHTNQHTNNTRANTRNNTRNNTENNTAKDSSQQSLYDTTNTENNTENNTRDNTTISEKVTHEITCTKELKDNKELKENKEKEYKEKESQRFADFAFEIIRYLNEKTGKSYKQNIEKTRSLILARKNEGFTLDDFKKVIDNKVKDWGNDPKMAEYLRPITLFSNKFESYLNQNNVSATPKGWQDLQDWHAKIKNNEELHKK